jgi:PAS domain S-box-containing protein
MYSDNLLADSLWCHGVWHIRNVKDQKTGNGSLQNNEREVWLAMDNAPALMAYVDADLRYRMVSDSYAEMFGSDASAMIGKSPEDVLGPDSFAFTKPLMDRALAGEIARFERQSVMFDGERRQFTITLVPNLFVEDHERRDGAVQAKGFYILMRDISELKNAAAALQVSEQRFRDIVEASSDWFWEMDEKLRLSYLSEHADDRGGIAISKMIGRAPWEIKDPDGQDAMWLGKFRALLGTREMIRDFRCRYKGGGDKKYHFVSINATPLFDEDGVFMGYRGSASDITKEVESIEAIKSREQAQKLFVDSLDLLPMSFLLLDPNDKLLYFNEYFRKFVERGEWEIRLGMSYEALLHAGIQSGSLVLLDNVGEDELVEAFLKRHRSLRIGDSIGGNRLHWRFADGTEFWAEGFRARTEDGCTLISYLDITDLVLNEEKLRQAQKMEAVGQLTGGIAHDFNNILAVVLGNLDLLAERASDRKDICDLVERAIKAAEQGALLTQRLLSFSRKQPLMPKSTDINRLIHENEDLLRRALGEQNELQLMYAPELWRCEVDPSQVENAILNLVINARDSMPGGGKLSIETFNSFIDDKYAAARVEVMPGEYVTFSVTDSGCGMSPDVEERIFEPFFTTKDVGQGSGLGLSMVYGFVKQSGGHIDVSSDEGKGTTFKIYLPRAASEDQPEIDAPEKHDDPAGQGQRILVVEDEELVGRQIRDLLVDLGYEVLLADNGPSALTLLKEAGHIDLLLTDVVLPGGMNGRGLAEAIMEQRPGMDVVYMSGDSADATVHHGRLDDDAVLLHKPFIKKGLAQTVREVLSRGSSADEKLGRHGP